ncbi:MFS transporter [Leifsonia sp. 21MFCrub1.1]|uniref:MFS transporter n=1 Tax=Leifsonia sp. 21MFCrub1.1 TaxID=1798223 RepID=UPI0008928550|nr:MFS transporter [Leifsonia sp. 21MFCrub1.1]SEA87254.1 Predicted arabinose efflux permease, MFS family [Leifsonia sp. 21MFCrub1.1]
MTANGLGARYAKLWTSASLSNLADGVMKVALPLVAVRYTDSPALIAGLTFAFTLPWLLFALTAGALADRLDRRRLMLIANAARALFLAFLTVATLTGIGSIWMLYAAALCIGVAETVYDTSAQSILPQLVPRDRLSRANGRLYAAELTANEFIGPPLGGFLVATGVALAFGTPVLLWVAAIGMLLLLRGRFRADRPERTTIRADIAEGLRFLGRSTLLRTLAIMVGVFNFASSAVYTVFVLYAVGPQSAMKLTDPAYGLLLTASAIGSVLGTFLAEPAERLLGRARALTLTVIGSLFTVATPFFTANPFLIAGGMLIGGITVSVWNVITVSLRQRVTPTRLLGRLNSAYRLLAWGTMPLGALAGGLIGQLFGVRWVFLVMGILVVLQLIPMLWITDRRMDDAESAAEKEEQQAVGDATSGR